MEKNNENKILKEKMEKNLNTIKIFYRSKSSSNIIKDFLIKN